MDPVAYYTRSQANNQHTQWAAMQTRERSEHSHGWDPAEFYMCGNQQLISHLFHTTPLDAEAAFVQHLAKRGTQQSSSEASCHQTSRVVKEPAGLKASWSCVKVIFDGQSN